MATPYTEGVCCSCLSFPSRWQGERRSKIIAERERANLVIQLARIFSCLSRCRSCRNILRNSKYTANEILHHAVIKSGLLAAGYHAFMPAVNAFMQAASSLRPPRGGDQCVYAAYQHIHASHRGTNVTGGGDQLFIIHAVSPT